jgi:predicted MFS family arabinose efflux permease
MSGSASRHRAATLGILRLPAGVVRFALVVRLLDEWWSYLPAGTIEDQRLDLGFSYTQSGWLLALLTLGGLVGAPLGALADRGHRRLMASGGAIVLATGLAAFAAGAPFAVLVVAATLLGAASDCVIRPLESSLAQVAGDGLDRVLGRQHLISWSGDFVGPVLLAIGAATWIGWQGVFAFTAGVFAVFAVLLALTEFPEPEQDADDSESLWRSAQSLARRPEVLLLAAAEFIMLPLDEAFLGFAVARLVADGFGAAAQLLAGGVVVGGIIGSAVIARRGLRPRRTNAAALVMVVGAFGAALGPGAAVQVVGMALLGFGTAVVWAAVHHRSLTVVPGRSATVPTVVGVLATPSLLVPVAMGWLADATSTTVAVTAAASLTVPLALVVLRLGVGVVAPSELDDD